MKIFALNVPENLLYCETDLDIFDLKPIVYLLGPFVSDPDHMDNNRNLFLISVTSRSLASGLSNIYRSLL